jgi:hypothetical protein
VPAVEARGTGGRVFRADRRLVKGRVGGVLASPPEK